MSPGSGIDKSMTLGCHTLAWGQNSVIETTPIIEVLPKIQSVTPNIPGVPTSLLDDVGISCLFLPSSLLAPGKFITIPVGRSNRPSNPAWEGPNVIQNKSDAVICAVSLERSEKEYKVLTEGMVYFAHLKPYYRGHLFAKGQVSTALIQKYQTQNLYITTSPQVSIYIFAVTEHLKQFLVY